MRVPDPSRKEATEDQRKFYEFPEEARPPTLVVPNPYPFAKAAETPWSAIARPVTYEERYGPKGDPYAAAVAAIARSEQYSLRSQKHPKFVPAPLDVEKLYAMAPKPAPSEVAPRARVALVDRLRLVANTTSLSDCEK